MGWAKPLHTKGRIDWAGELLAAGSTSATPSDAEQAESIINNWRAVHSYPLHAMKITLKRRAKKIDSTVIVAQRLKRLASIKLKLAISIQAGNHPSLSQMQDIGGCRAVLKTVGQVRALEKVFLDASKKAPHRGSQYLKTSDYIASPKANGYRSVHLVYKYRTTSPQHRCYNGQRIEIQIRSRLQHYWATAVETYSTFTGEALKSNIGSDEWKRFFALVGSVMALMEDSPTVSGTPNNLADLIPEIDMLFKKLNVNNVLSGWSAVTNIAASGPPELKGAAMYLLVLDPDKFQLHITGYKIEQLAVANREYARIEKEQPNLQAVLVSVDSLAALRTAYPNYFLDTTNFLGVVNSAIKGVDERKDSEAAK